MEQMTLTERIERVLAGAQLTRAEADRLIELVKARAVLG